MGKKVLIATLYGSSAVIYSITKLSPDRVILLVNKESNPKQEESIKKIKEAFGSFIDIKTVKIDAYDMVKTATKTVEIIDLQPSEEDIYINMTSGRKTMALGVIYASYARHNRVKRIVYYPEEKNETILLPRISFKLTSSQKQILEYLEEHNGISIKELSEAVDLSTAMVYRAIDELKDMDFVSTENGLELTGAGKIAKL